MARYIGPTSKIARKFGEAILGPSKELKKKNYPPGQHGKNKRRKQSDYAVQLSEKQKAKYTYGVLERQFRKTFEKASHMHGVTGTNLLRLLEARLDNVIYRLGLAPTRRAARQLVNHGHISVNGQLVGIPSYSVKIGEKVSVREKSKQLKVIVESMSGKQNRLSWLQWDATSMEGSIVSLPDRGEIPENIKEQLIVELYSK